MYVPRAFAVDDIKILHQQMQASPLPVLVTHASQGLLASHVPMLLNPDEGPCGTLYGHLARANPHWQDLAQGTEALVIFAGEQAYISPTFYPGKADHGKAVPTWNYLAVHAYGMAEVFDDAERLLALVSRLKPIAPRPGLSATPPPTMSTACSRPLWAFACLSPACKANANSARTATPATRLVCARACWPTPTRKTTHSLI